MTIYPSYASVVQTHFYLIDRFGGAHGIRDSGAIESALARPRSGYYSNLVEEAAALIESLSQNHPFVDGNKRTAIAISMGFLAANGYELKFDDREAYKFFIQLYEERRFKFQFILKWLGEHAIKK